jgi:hypothetical protein
MCVERSLCLKVRRILKRYLYYSYRAYSYNQYINQHMPLIHMRALLLILISKYCNFMLNFWRDNVFGFAGLLGVRLWKGDVTAWGYARKVWRDVTSRYIDSGGHVTRRHSDVTIWPLRFEPPRKSVFRRAAGGMRAIRWYEHSMYAIHLIFQLS